MNFVFSSNRPVSAFSSRPFTSIPNNSAAAAIVASWNELHTSIRALRRLNLTAA
jgi:hypothetical protein